MCRLLERFHYPLFVIVLFLLNVIDQKVPIPINLYKEEEIVVLERRKGINERYKESMEEVQRIKEVD